MKCPSCNSEAPNDSRFYDVCGAAPVRCPSCGAANRAGARFSFNCANALTAQPRQAHWFTEGFDTPDLKEAKALLDELA
jgi:hypothetical protein